MAEPEDLRTFAKSLLDDAAARLQYQHEYTLAGFKALFLMNGGAIIGLLTFAGNVADQSVSSRLGAAFLWYVAGLALAVLGYLSAYGSQAAFMNHSQGMAMDILDIEREGNVPLETYYKRGGWIVALGVALSVAALGSFLVGSTRALHGLNQRASITANAKPMTSATRSLEKH